MNFNPGISAYPYPYPTYPNVSQTGGYGQTPSYLERLVGTDIANLLRSTGNGNPFDPGYSSSVYGVGQPLSLSGAFPNQNGINNPYGYPAGGFTGVPVIQIPVGQSSAGFLANVASSLVTLIGSLVDQTKQQQ